MADPVKVNEPVAKDENEALPNVPKKEVDNGKSKASSSEVFVNPTDDDIDKRLDALKAFMLKDMKSKQYTNVGIEIGRPKLQPMDILKPDTSNIFTRPSVDLLLEKGWRAESIAVATGEQLTQIAAKLQALGVPPEEVAIVMWDIVMYCASTSSSQSMDPTGVVEFNGGAITRDSVVATIREYSTLRKVCRAYAPVVWQYMCVTGQPPANWQAMGFSNNTKYAAFDFFDYVKNPACIKPLEGLIRLPTKEEEIAHATHKQIALDRNARNNRFANTSTEITGGKFGCDFKRKWRESSCD
ncbi:coat protein [Elderberry carlavirus B]|uniref:coat protein n=1 Tax=Elderberry carlavirus B TaxID=1569053 RepID=UPI00054A7CED|nr:coat protein [Elderberry carlavirus B]AIZ76623.1 coat protein [Elderberry carlavirus B]